MVIGAVAPGGVPVMVALVWSGTCIGGTGVGGTGVGDTGAGCTGVGGTGDVGGTFVALMSSLI